MKRISAIFLFLLFFSISQPVFAVGDAFNQLWGVSTSLQLRSDQQRHTISSWRHGNLHTEISDNIQIP